MVGVSVGVSDIVGVTVLVGVLVGVTVFVGVLVAVLVGVGGVGVVQRRREISGEVTGVVVAEVEDLPIL